MSSVGSLSDKSLLLSTVQMDDSQQHPSYQVSGVLSTNLNLTVLKTGINYLTVTLAASTFTAGPIVVVMFTDFM